MYSFHFKWSYQNRAGYRFDAGEIETHRELGWLDRPMREGYNGDAESFERNVVSAIGGAQVHWNNRSGDAWRRWTAELYDAFVADVKRCHAESVAYTQALAAKHPELDWSESLNRPLVVPRPIYWAEDTRRFETEPFYGAGLDHHAA